MVGGGAFLRSTFLDLVTLIHMESTRADMPTVNDGTLLVATLCDILTARQNRKPRVIYLICRAAKAQKRVLSH